MAEWSKALDSKSSVPSGYLGFESLSLRQLIIRQRPEKYNKPREIGVFCYLMSSVIQIDVLTSIIFDGIF